MFVNDMELDLEGSDRGPFQAVITVFSFRTEEKSDKYQSGQEVSGPKFENREYEMGLSFRKHSVLWAQIINTNV
jgi:hypothetical protein